MRTRHVLAVLYLFLAGCAVTPALDYSGPEVSDIVQRIRCELAHATPALEGKYPTGKYQWLRDWTAHVDLTLEVNETAGITASTSYIEPLAKIGQVAQTFTFGAGAGVTGTANRTDKLAFTVGLAELIPLKISSECDLPFRLGLLGRLGLKEWIKSALQPVEDNRLVIGYHEAAGKTGRITSPVSGVTPRASQKEDDEVGDVIQKVIRLGVIVGNIKKDLETAEGKLSDGEIEILQAQRYANEAQKYALLFKGRGIRPALGEMQNSYSNSLAATKALERATDAFDLAKATIWRAKLDLPTLKKVKVSVDALLATAKVNDFAEFAKKFPGQISEKEVTEFDGYMASAKDYLNATGIIKTTSDEMKVKVKDASDFAASVTKLATDAWNILPQSPPLDSLAHTAKFTVVANANATPNWSLVRFKGPGAGNSPFFSAQRTRTHTLELVMGAPATPGGRDLSEEQRRQLLSFRLEALRVLVLP